MLVDEEYISVRLSEFSLKESIRQLPILLDILSNACNELLHHSETLTVGTSGPGVIRKEIL